MIDVPGAKIEPTDEGQSGSILSFEDFNALYCALTGHDGACRWQHRLFTDLEAGRFPTDIELATGLGKDLAHRAVGSGVGARARAPVERRAASARVRRRSPRGRRSGFGVRRAGTRTSRGCREGSDPRALRDRDGAEERRLHLFGRRGVHAPWPTRARHALAGRPDASRNHRRHGRHDRLSPSFQRLRPRGAPGAARSRPGWLGRTVCSSSTRLTSARPSLRRSPRLNAASARWLRSPS